MKMEGKWCTESVHVLPHEPNKGKEGKKGGKTVHPICATLCTKIKSKKRENIFCTQSVHPFAPKSYQRKGRVVLTAVRSP